MCRACHVERFFEHVLYKPLGFQLLRWQRKTLRDIYGTINTENGERRYRRAYLEIPKKNGKSFLLGGMPLYHLTAEDVDNPEAYGAAAARDQAALVFKTAARLLKANPMLQQRLKLVESTKRIVRRDGRGFYVVLSADGDLQDGIEPSLALIDELHRWKNAKARTLHEVLLAGQISRPEPLAVEITTAGEVYESPLCWTEHEVARQVLEGSIKSDRFYPAIWSANEAKVKADPEYWKSKEARVEANPSHVDNGGFLQDEAIADMQGTLTEQAYRRYCLNIWGQKAERWMPSEAWLTCAAPTRALIGRKCWIGVDLSKSSDLTAVVAVFPSDDDTIDILPFFWLPKLRIPHIRKRVKVPIERWCNEGLIETNDDMVVDYNLVRKKLDWMRETFRVQEICYDPYNATHFIGQLAGAGYTCVEVRQGPTSLSAPMKWILELALQGKIRHGGHEVMAWNADCVSVRTDSNGNIAPEKSRLEHDGKRIDGMSALVTAAFRAMLVGKKKNPYSAGARLMSI